MGIFLVGIILESAIADPEINLINNGCSQYNATNKMEFFRNRNATFADLRNQISQEKKLFATGQQSRSSDPVYAMVQCRNYLSPADCLACYDAAVVQILNCSAANGARVIYDGCFLRYSWDKFLLLPKFSVSNGFHNSLLEMNFLSTIFSSECFTAVI